MVAYQILEVGNFMNLLLSDKVFDSFSVNKVTIRTIADFFVDGKRNREWCEECDGEYVYWQELKDFVFERIKGKRKPEFLKTELLVDREGLFSIFPDIREETKDFPDCMVNSFRLNFKYEAPVGGQEFLGMTTGVSYDSFCMDRRWEQYWDEKAVEFLKGLSLTLDKM